MNQNKPNLSLLFAYLFLLLVLVLFALIQFSSSHNLKAIETALESQILSYSMIQNDGDLKRAIAACEKLKGAAILSNLSTTFSDSENLCFSKSIQTMEDLQTTLRDIRLLLDSYSNDLNRSQAILFISFVGLSIIFSVLLTVSEFDQIKIRERERLKGETDQKLIEVLEQERNLIALELHDEVAQKLSVLSQHFNDSSHDHSVILKRYAADVIHNIRTIAHSLRSPELEGGNFQKQIEFLYSDFSSLSKIHLEARFNGLSCLQIDNEKQLHLYRVLQELLSNCRKHSQASQVEINLLYVHPVLKISYADNGVGINFRNKYPGLGLKSIEYRINILKGEMHMNSDEGFKMFLTIPVVL